MDPVHGYEAVNVEAQRRDPSSFLHWLRRVLAVRRGCPVFATGSLQLLPADNPSVLAYLRAAAPAETAEAAEEVPPPVLCVHNLSRFAQPATLSLTRFAGCVPVEMLGRVPFPLVGDGAYSLTLAPYGFYWFELRGEAP